ncbi:YidH family protein [Antribacter gilvus]|uniref:YidH family protein n=1 Tax=Antribacter gilvus TaxID=2304675 RepID=UPI000F7A9622|nr:DUF202 domain-containing protein [Antribacter gilvus]
MTDRRFPRQVYREGSEPDPRFTLANERTFLAWVRTSLALVAGAIALEALQVPGHSGLRTSAVVLLLVLGFALPPAAWVGWARNERAMRRGDPLPASLPTLFLVVGIPAVAVLALLGSVLS